MENTFEPLMFASSTYDDEGSFTKRRHFEGSLSRQLFKGIFEKLTTEHDATSQSSPKMIARCLLCTHKRVTIKAAMGVTSNLITHLKRKHPCELEMFYQKKCISTNYRKQDKPQNVADDRMMFLANNATTSTIRPKKLLFTQFFEKLQDDHEKLIAKCLLCQSLIKGSAQVTSNFIRHLKRKHATEFQNYYLDDTRNMTNEQQQQQQIAMPPQNGAIENVKLEPEETLNSNEFDNTALPLKSNEQCNLDLVKEENMIEHVEINEDSSSHLINDNSMLHDTDSKLMKRSTEQLLFNKFFKTVKVDSEQKMIATCLLCKIDIVGNVKITTNCIQHLKSVHPDDFFLFKNQQYAETKLKNFNCDMLSEYNSSNASLEEEANPLNRKSTIIKQYFIKLTSETTGANKSMCASGAKTCAARCLICSKIIKGVEKVSSNYIQHLRRRHPEAIANYYSQRGRQTDQEKFYNDIIDFVIQTGQSFNIVENVYFKQLFQNRIQMRMPNLNEIVELAKSKGYFLPNTI